MLEQSQGHHKALELVWYGNTWFEVKRPEVAQQPVTCPPTCDLLSVLAC
jgi:hypothetical protein